MPAQAKHNRRSPCPLNAVVEILGDHWSLLVIRDLMFKGAHTFKDLMDGGEHIATNILTDRLHRLSNDGLIVKVQDSHDRRQYRYRLTRKGIDLAPALIQMILWAARHEQTGAPPDIIQQMQANPDAFLAKLTKKWEQEGK